MCLLPGGLAFPNVAAKGRRQCLNQRIPDLGRAGKTALQDQHSGDGSCHKKQGVRCEPCYSEGGLRKGRRRWCKEEIKTLKEKCTETSPLGGGGPRLGQDGDYGGAGRTWRGRTYLARNGFVHYPDCGVAFPANLSNCVTVYT